METDLGHVCVEYFFAPIELTQFNLLVVAVVDGLGVGSVCDPGLKLDVSKPIFLQGVMRGDFEKQRSIHDMVIVVVRYIVWGTIEEFSLAIVRVVHRDDYDLLLVRHVDWVEKSNNVDWADFHARPGVAPYIFRMAWL